MGGDGQGFISKKPGHEHDMEELMELRNKRFGYANETEYMPPGVVVDEVAEMSHEREDIIVRNNDKNIDAVDGRETRLMPGGMTVWYMMEALTLTDTCSGVLSDMRATRNYNEVASKTELLELETEIKKQNYDITVQEWMALHHKFCRKVTDILDMDSSCLYSLVPACVLHEWVSKSEKYNC